MADPIVEIIETVETEVIVEVDCTSEIIETVETETLVETETEIVEDIEQGPPGVQGPQGIKGDPGEATLEGFEVDITNPQPGDVLILVNQKVINEDILDGGNF